MNASTILASADNRVTRVAVFRDSARITRRATTNIASGVNRIAVQVLADRVEQSSLLARVFAAGELLGVQYRETPVVRSPREEVEALERELDAAIDKEAEIAAQERRVAKQMTFLDHTVEFSKIQVPAEIQTRLPSAEQLTDTLAFLNTNYQQLGVQKADIAIDMRAATRHREAIEKRLKQLRKGTSHRERVVEVLFRSDKAAENISVEVDYRAIGARWTPQYKVDIDEALTTIHMAMLARIEQRTGEDWGDAELTLSSGQANEGGELPRPQPWRVSPPRTRMATRGAKMAAAAPVALGAAPDGGAEEADFALLDVAEAAPAPMVSGERKETALTVEYTPAARYDVPSGPDATIVPVESKPVPGEFFHRAVPRSQNAGYLVCRLAPGADLLAGTMNIHLDGHQIATTTLGVVPAGEKIDLNLGRDRQVLVAREKMKDHRAETFFGVLERGNTAREFKYRVRIENRKSVPVTIELFDAEPVSTIDTIEIKGVEWSPGPDETDFDGREGVHCWRFQLQPGGAKQIDLAFHAKHPRAMTPQGL